MSNRRNFIKKAGILSAFLALNPWKAEELIPQKSKKIKKPVVLSTWRFGLQANEEAWKVLSKGGRALDAVEKGVRLVENDPNERSVGYGGRPDRDGKVTLDACIMDEKANIGSVACLENIKNPISVARAVMEKTPHVMLVGDGALQFAISQGFKKDGIELTGLDNFEQGSKSHVENHLVCLYNAEERVARARSKIGVNSYNVMFNNCEHFVNWCFDGYKSSSQVGGRNLSDGAKDLAVVGAVSLIPGVGQIAVAGYLGSKLIKKVRRLF